MGGHEQYALVRTGTYAARRSHVSAKEWGVEDTLAHSSPRASQVPDIEAKSRVRLEGKQKGGAGVVG